MALAALVAGCGGGSDSPVNEASESAAQDAPAPASADDASTDDANAELGSDPGERPDWLPAWTLLPADLTITQQRYNPTKGEAAISGFITGGDAQLLFDQAQFNVQSGGYLLSDVFNEDQSKTFKGEHTSNGRTVSFVVVTLADGTVSWGLDFSGLTEQ